MIGSTTGVSVTTGSATSATTTSAGVSGSATGAASTTATTGAGGGAGGSGGFQFSTVIPASWNWIPSEMISATSSSVSRQAVPLPIATA